MKHSYSYIVKKEYQKPTIEEILLDREMSLVMYSPPPGEPGNTEPLPTGVAPSSPDYGTKVYKTEPPFGGSKPAY